MPLNELIPIINKLQEAFAPLDIPPVDLPQVCERVLAIVQLTLNPKP